MSGRERAERSEAGGSSNTPLSSYIEKRYGTCVDYLKFRFDFGPKEIDEALRGIFKTLRVSYIGGTKKPGRNNYAETIVLGDEMFVYQGGTATMTKEGSETCLLELKGKGCREFEERYWSNAAMSGTDLSREAILNKAWAELIEGCVKIGGVCTRIDLTTDDFSGNITMEEVKSKIQKREFTAKMRRIELTSSEENTVTKDPYLDDMINVHDSKRSGYTATLGSRDRLQLCIYDKAAEQINKGNDTKLDSWIRYEVRFMKANAEKEIPRFLKALKEGKESAHIVGCLSSIFEFKEPNKLDKSNLSKAKTWQKWAEFVKEAEIPEAFANTPWTMTIETNAKFLMTSCSGSFVRVLAALDADIVEVGTMMILHELERMEGDGLEIINQYRRSRGLKEFKSIDSFKRFMGTRGDLAYEFNPLVTELLAPEVAKRKKKGGDDEQDK